MARQIGEPFYFTHIMFLDLNPSLLGNFDIHIIRKFKIKMTPAPTVLMVGIIISIVGAIMLLSEKHNIQAEPIVSQAQFNNDSALLFELRKLRLNLKKRKAMNLKNT